MTPDATHGIKPPSRFTIQRRLGAGGFGVVYEAFDRDRDAVIALKQLTRNDPTALFRFKREFRSLADLAHPNLVRLYELIADDDQWLLAMELVRGVDFLDYVQELPPFGVPPLSGASPASATAPTIASASESAGEHGTVRVSRVRATFRPDALRAGLEQLVAGVRYLHQHDILHRDIKPSNVLVTDEGRVVLLDFGLATEFATARPEDSMRIAGTPEYMSPEQAAGEPLTEASDWYSVGVVLYRALTGVPPFSGSFVSMLLEKQRRDPVRPRELVPDVPDDLDSLCCDLLKRDPVARSTGLDILRRLSGSPASASPAAIAADVPPRAHPFIGRQDQLAAARAAFDATRQGGAVTLYIRGRSGMGKTALVRQVLNGLKKTHPDVVVLSGRCYEQEAVPYKALDSLVDALADYLRSLPRRHVESLLPRGVWALARVFPVLQRVDAIVAAPRPAEETRDWHELRRRASSAFREMLGRIAERRPLVLFIDDLQWGDVDSASLLTDLLRPPDQPSLLLMASYRGEETAAGTALHTLLTLHDAYGGDADVRTIELGELSTAEAGELARTLVGDTAESVARAEIIARESGGHPFFIDQLVRYGSSGVRETTLDAVLLARVAQLSERSRTLLEITSVAGRPIDVVVAAKAADLGSGDHDVVAMLRAAQLIRTRATGTREMEPYHDRVRETIVASLAPETLQRHHQRLADALESTGRADPEALAVHFRGAGDDVKAARYALAAAEQAAAALAFERAARLYRLALELRPVDSSERRRLRVKLGDALANGGRVIEAAHAYQTAADGAAPLEQRELQRQAAEQFLMGGYLDEGLALLRNVLADAGLPMPATSRRALLAILLRRPWVLLRGTRFQSRREGEIPPDDLWRVDLCQSAVRSLGFTQTIPAIELQMRHLLLALKVGEPYRVAIAMGFEAIADARHRRGRRRAERLLRITRGLADTIPPHNRPGAAANIHVTTGMLAFLSGHWKTASRELEQAEHLFREQAAVPYKLVVVQVYTLSALFHAGDLTEYFRRIPECLKESLDRGNAFAEANLRLQNAHRKCFSDDQPEAALQEHQDAMARWSPRGFLQIHATELFERGDFALYQGDGRAAWEALGEGWPRLRRSLLLGLESIRVSALYLRARAAIAMAAEATGSRDAFLNAAEGDAHDIERQKSYWGPPLADLVHAAVALDRGDRTRALARLLSAESGFEATDMALHAAVVRSRRGVLIGGDEGRSLVDAADRWMVSHGVRNPARMCAMYAPGRWSA